MIRLRPNDTERLNALAENAGKRPAMYARDLLIRALNGNGSAEFASLEEQIQELREELHEAREEFREARADQKSEATAQRRLTLKYLRRADAALQRKIPGNQDTE